MIWLDPVIPYSNTSARVQILLTARTALCVDRRERPIADLRHAIKCCSLAFGLLPFVRRAAFWVDQLRQGGTKLPLLERPLVAKYSDRMGILNMSEMAQLLVKTLSNKVGG